MMSTLNMIIVNILVSLNIKGNYLALISVFAFSIIISYVSCRYVEEPFNRYVKSKFSLNNTYIRKGKR